MTSYMSISDIMKYVKRERYVTGVSKILDTRRVQFTTYSERSNLGGMIQVVRVGKVRTEHFSPPNLQTNIELINISSRFYYPFGKPSSSISLEQQTLQRLQAAFDQFPNKQVPKENFTNILKICALPLYWRMPLYHCAVITPNGLCDGKKFIEFWKQ